MQQRSFVLIPGAGGNAAFWQRVEPLLQKAGYRTCAVTLPNWPSATFPTTRTRSSPPPARRRKSPSSLSRWAVPLPLNLRPATGLRNRAAERHDPGTRRDGWGMVGQYRSGRGHAEQRPARRVAIPMQASMRRPISFMTCHPTCLRCCRTRRSLSTHSSRRASRWIAGQTSRPPLRWA